MPASAEIATGHSTTRETETPLVLVADDQPHILEALQLLLKPEGYRVQTARSPLMAIEALNHETFDAVLIDLNYTRDTTSGAEGLDLLAQIVAQDSHLPVVVMTAWGNVELAVESMRRGACDFIQKPWDNARLLSILRTQIELRRAQRKAEILEAENRLLRAEGKPELIATAASMQPVLETDLPRRPVGRQCVDYRRTWNRQRDSGADPACFVLPRRHSTGRRKYWCAAGGNV